MVNVQDYAYKFVKDTFIDSKLWTLVENETKGIQSKHCYAASRVGRYVRAYPTLQFKPNSDETVDVYVKVTGIEDSLVVMAETTKHIRTIVLEVTAVDIASHDSSVDIEDRSTYDEAINGLRDYVHRQVRLYLINSIRHFSGIQPTLLDCGLQNQLNIFSFLSLGDISRVDACCHTIRNPINSSELWKPLSSTFKTDNTRISDPRKARDMLRTITVRSWYNHYRKSMLHELQRRLESIVVQSKVQPSSHFLTPQVQPYGFREYPQRPPIGEPIHGPWHGGQRDHRHFPGFSDVPTGGHQRPPIGEPIHGPWNGAQRDHRHFPGFSDFPTGGHGFI